MSTISTTALPHSHSNFPCFSVYLANYLTTKGFRIINQVPNKRDPSRLVYFFEDSPELRHYVELHTNTYGRRGE